MTTEVQYRSANVLLELSTWQVRVGDTVITPEPKVFELLAYLMRNPARLVTFGAPVSCPSSVEKPKR